MNIKLRYLVNGEERRSSDLENEDYVLRIEQQEERTTIEICSKKPLVLVTCSIKQPYQFAAGSQIFVNGYQSWTDTREYDLSEYIHNMNRVPKNIIDRFHFNAYGDAWFLPYHKDNFHGFTYSYVKKPDGQADFFGSFNEQNAYLILHYKKRENEISIRSDCQYKQLDGEFCLFDYVHYKGGVKEVLDRYFSQYGTCDVPSVRGYTSWYLHYQDISEEKMNTALSGISKEHFDLFQIDDGYETFVGDWLDIDQQKFPNGLKPVVEKIHRKGLKAGIWLAPFVCETKSRTFKEHPDWLYKENGQPVFAGSNWSGDVVLDIRKPEVTDYIRQCLTFYMDAGFDFFKLDFLYAAALIHEGGGKTRAEMMRGGMEFLREILKEKLILGCGVPLSSAFGLVDYCRIGPDVSLKFDDVFYMRPMHRERISTKVTLQNTIYRSAMDQTVFRCDPDVFLLRDDNIDLSNEQKKALIMLNYLCGAVYMTSDNVATYDAQKHAIWEEAKALQNAEITDISKTNHIISIKYLLNGTEQLLCYDRNKGVLV